MKSSKNELPIQSNHLNGIKSWKACIYKTLVFLRGIFDKILWDFDASAALRKLAQELRIIQGSKLTKRKRAWITKVTACDVASTRMRDMFNPAQRPCMHLYYSSSRVAGNSMQVRSPNASITSIRTPEHACGASNRPGAGESIHVQPPPEPFSISLRVSLSLFAALVSSQVVVRLTAPGPPQMFLPPSYEQAIATSTGAEKVE